jgi:hypothetical protein
MNKAAALLFCIALYGCSSADDRTAVSSTMENTPKAISEVSASLPPVTSSAAPASTGSMPVAVAEPETPEEDQQPSAFRVGDIAYSSDGGRALVYSSEEVWMDETHDDMEAGIEGTHPLIKTVGPRTRLKLLEERTPIWRVKVLDGEHTGEQWWIRETWLEKLSK